jgi:hypothetical protein
MVKKSAYIESEETHGYKVISGPSFSDGLPKADDWLSFKEKIKNPEGLDLVELWYAKAREAKGIPLRSDFNFAELVNYGQYLYLGKLNEEMRWETTFCGDGIVREVGYELTGKCLDDLADNVTLEFWEKNLKLLTDESKPFLELFTLEYIGREHIHCKEINLPLMSGNREFPDMNMAYNIYTRERIGL